MKTVLTGIVAVALCVGMTSLPSLVQGADGAAPNVSPAGETPAKETGTVIGKVIDSDNNLVKGAGVAIVIPMAPLPKANAAAKGDAPESIPRSSPTAARGRWHVQDRERPGRQVHGLGPCRHKQAAGSHQEPDRGQGEGNRGRGHHHAAGAKARGAARPQPSK